VSVVSHDTALLVIFISILGLTFAFVLKLRLRDHWNRFDGLYGPTDTANQRAMALLKTCLTPEQRQQYEKLGFFYVIGSETGRLYRIKHGTQNNIVEINKTDLRTVCGWCFLPEGRLAAGDVMLAQKIALENRELETLAIANRF
jgi:hypothetical protein